MKTKIYLAMFKGYYIKKIRIHLIYILIMIDIAICGYSYLQWQQEFRYQESHGDANTTRAAIVSPANAASSGEDFKAGMIKDDNKVTNEMTTEEYIASEVKKAGLSVNEVFCIIRNESGWNEYAINKNSNGTYDIGILQINDIHGISRKNRFDYKFSIKWAIEKRLHDGNWNSWYGFKNCK